MSACVGAGMSSRLAANGDHSALLLSIIDSVRRLSPNGSASFSSVDSLLVAENG